MRERKGFTLIELMVVVAIIGVIASLAPRVLIEIQRFFLMNRTRVTLQRDARAAMALVTRNLRQAVASSVIIDRLPDNPDTAGTDPQPVYSRITFLKQDNTTGALSDNSRISYYQQGRKLKMSVTTGTRTITKDLCQNLRFMAFALPESADLTIVSVSMTLEQNIFEGRLKALHLASEKVRVMNT